MLPCGCLSIHLSYCITTYILLTTLEKPKCLISYGTKNIGIRLSSGMHLYITFVFLRPYDLLSARISTAGISPVVLTAEWISVNVLLTYVKVSFVNNLWLRGLKLGIWIGSNDDTSKIVHVS